MLSRGLTLMTGEARVASGENLQRREYESRDDENYTGFVLGPQCLGATPVFWKTRSRGDKQFSSKRWDFDPRKSI